MLFKRKKPIRKKAYSVRLVLYVHEKAVTLNSTGLRAMPELTWLEVASVIKFLIKSRYFIFWGIGDFCNYAVDQFGINKGFLKGIYASDVSKKYGFGKSRLQQVMRVCKTVPMNMRVDGLNPHLQYYIFTMADIGLAHEICQKGFKEGWDIDQYIEERELHYPEVGRGMISNLIKS